MGVLLFCLIWIGCKEKQVVPNTLAVSPRSEVAFFGRLKSQIASDDPPARLHFDFYSTEQGLCSNVINGLLIDKQGLLWIGTDDGINCYDGYTFTAYRHRDKDPLSLPDNTICAIAADSSLGVWVLTSHGLSQINPINHVVTSYKPDSTILSNLDKLHGNIVLAGRDTIWIRGNGANGFDLHNKRYFSTGSKSFTDFAPGSGSEVFSTCTFDSIDAGSGHHTFHDRVSRYNPGKYRFETVFDTVYQDPDHHLELCEPIAMTSDRAGQLFLAYANGDAAIFKTTTRQWRHWDHHPQGPARRYGLGSTSLDCHFGAQSGMIWLAGFDGIVRINPRSNVKVPIIRYTLDERNPDGLKEKVCTAILEDHSGNIWVGTEGGGLFKYAPSANKFDCFKYYVRDSISLLSPHVEDLLFDRENRLWVATNKGLNLLTDPTQGRFDQYVPSPGPKRVGNYYWVRSMAEDPATGLFYLGYWGSPPGVFSPETGSFDRLPVRNWRPGAFDSLGWGFFTNQVSTDGTGNFFFADFGGLLEIYNTNRQTFYAHNQDEVANPFYLSKNTRCVFPAGDSCLWLGYEGNRGIQMLDLKKGRQLLLRCQDPNNGAYIQQSQGTFVDYISSPGDTTRLQGGSSICFYKDNRKRLWVGTVTGLYQMTDPGRGIFKRFGTANGFENETVQSVQEDAHGRFWIGTNRGLSCFDPDQGRVLRNFNHLDGLFGSQFNPRCSARSKNGLLAFGGQGGFIVFHPDSLYLNTSIPQIRLNALLANDHEIPLYTTNIVLPHDSNSLALRFAALDFSQTAENRYFFRIAGPNIQQEGTLTQPMLQLFNLAPGQYQIALNGSNNDGIWGRGATLSVRICPPWWQNNWFLLLLGLGIVSFTLWLFRQRIASVRKDSDRDRTIKYLQAQSLQAQLNPHFIFNVLTTMQSKILDNSPQEASRMLVDLSKLIRNFLEASISTNLRVPGEFDEIGLDKEIELLEMYVGFEALKNDYRFKFQGVKLKNGLQPGNESIPPIIIQPFVENAIKHGLLYRNDNLGELYVTFSKEGEDIICTIEDNGVGRRKAGEIQRLDSQLYRSRGTELVEKRISILNLISYNIQINTRDRPNCGTIVVVRIGYKDEAIL
jgi:hypothetical protein